MAMTAIKNCTLIYPAGILSPIRIYGDSPRILMHVHVMSARGEKKNQQQHFACSCKSHNWQRESIISSANIQENQAVSRCHGCHVPAPMMCLHVGAAVDFFLLAVLCHSKLFISGEATWRWHLDNKSTQHSIYRGKGHAGLWNESGNEIYNPRSIYFFLIWKTKYFRPCPHTAGHYYCYLISGFFCTAHTQTELKVTKVIIFGKLLPEDFQKLCFPVCVYTGKPNFCFFVCFFSLRRLFARPGFLKQQHTNGRYN